MDWHQRVPASCLFFIDECCPSGAYSKLSQARWCILEKGLFCVKCFYQTGSVLVVQHEYWLPKRSRKFDNLESTRKCNVFRCPSALLYGSNTSFVAWCRTGIFGLFCWPFFSLSWFFLLCELLQHKNNTTNLGGGIYKSPCSYWMYTGVLLLHYLCSMKRCNTVTTLPVW